MPTIDYAQWPSKNDVLDRLSAAGIVLRAGLVTDRTLAAMSGVITEIGHRTQRQFQPDPGDTVRLYDGTGTAEQEVDEMVSLTSVNIVGLDLLPVYTLSTAALNFEQGRPQTRLTVAHGSVPAYISQGVIQPFQYIFPAGRQNIQVTGRFGYAETIPSDLWDAAAGEMALRLAREALFVQAGRVSLVKEGDEEKKFELSEATFTGWHEEFERKVSSRAGGYKRPNGRRLRNLRPPMVV